MRKRRAAKKSLGLVKKEAVVETTVGGSDVVTPEPEVVIVAANVPLPLTATDAKFEEAYPEYFIYMKEVKKRKCRKCDKSYETRLELNQFCSPKCKTEFLKQFQTFGRAHE